MKVNIILFLLVAGSIFVVGTDGAGIRTATGGEFSEGFTVTPGDVPLSDIESPLEDSSGCKNTPNCSKAAQDALFLKSSSDCDNCSKTGGTGMTGIEDETGVEMDPLPPPIKQNP